MTLISHRAGTWEDSSIEKMMGTESKCTIESSGGGKCTIGDEEEKVHN